MPLSLRCPSRPFVMNSYMSAEITRRDKLPFANLAVIWAFTTVGQHVRMKISRCCEGFRTNFALIRFLACMSPHVPSEIA